jgi:hypothetical protein
MTAVTAGHRRPVGGPAWRGQGAQLAQFGCAEQRLAPGPRFAHGQYPIRIPVVDMITPVTGAG